jgi:hypothetical protein
VEVMDETEQLQEAVRVMADALYMAALMTYREYGSPVDSVFNHVDSAVMDNKIAADAVVDAKARYFSRSRRIASGQ